MADPANTLPPDLVDLATLSLVAGQAVPLIERHLTDRTGDRAQAAAVIQAARSRITVAADYCRDEQLGKAVLRLEDVYAKAMSARPPDTRAAITAQKELNRLLQLYSPPLAFPGSDGTAAQSTQDLALIASYVVPLGLAANDYPLPEHVRIAVDLVRRHGLAAAVEGV